MATNFPSSQDSFTNPTTSDTLATVSHSGQHADANDAIEAIELALLDGAPLHIDAANERVGVGTTSPVDPLHVVGDVTIEVSDGGSAAQPEVTLHRGSTTPANGDYLGQLKFSGENDNGQTVNYAKITGKISDVTDGTEDGLIEIANIKAGSQSIGYRFTSTDLKLLNGRGLEVDGDVGVGTTPSYKLDVDGDINATGDLRIGGTAVGEAVTTWQPTWDSGVTVGNGTVTTSYYVLNDFVYYTVDFELGSTSAITGDIRIYHPFTADSKWQVAANLSGFAYDWSSASYYAVMGRTYLEARTTVRYARQHTGTNQAIYARQFSSPEPFTWGASDRLVFSTWYKKA